MPRNCSPDQPEVPAYCFYWKAVALTELERYEEAWEMWQEYLENEEKPNNP